MQATLETISSKKVSLTGLKSTWIVKDKDIVDLDGSAFIRMDPRCRGLCAMVAEGIAEAENECDTLKDSQS